MKGRCERRGLHRAVNVDDAGRHAGLASLDVLEEARLEPSVVGRLLQQVLADVGVAGALRVHPRLVLRGGQPCRPLAACQPGQV